MKRCEGDGRAGGGGRAAREEGGNRGGAEQCGEPRALDELWLELMLSLALALFVKPTGASRVASGDTVLGPTHSRRPSKGLLGEGPSP